VEELQLGLRQVDMWEGELEVFPIERDPDCPACGQRRFEHLNAKTESRTVSLCGRDAVQVSVHGRVSLEDLAAKLRPSAEVTLNPFLLRVRVEGYEMHIFPDGRAIIKGTTDPAIARALYSKYVGI
jgi:adenylyltransferase/sulfurtransferase